MVLSVENVAAVIPATYSREQAITKMNRLAATNSPFFFIISFDQSRSYIVEEEVGGMYFDIQGERNFDLNSLGSSIATAPFFNTFEISQYPEALRLTSQPEAFADYEHKFNYVKHHIEIGNSFLVNLTSRTPITINLSLKEIFFNAKAKYKVLLENKMVCFSPEPFVTVRDGIISSYPMKGTIDASIPNAAQLILDDAKEMAEHVTIVDLIRNDLSQVADHVHVARFRYLEKVVSPNRSLLQVSSEIVGHLLPHYQQNVGSLLFTLLPAGSISGAPKPKTVQIINDAEQTERGLFTGICGYFDGKNLDSGVMIRFIEQVGDKFFFRSGGGITYSSEAEKEYDEMIKKIYVPIY